MFVLLAGIIVVTGRHSLRRTLGVFRICVSLLSTALTVCTCKYFIPNWLLSKHVPIKLAIFLTKFFGLPEKTQKVLSKLLNTSYVVRIDRAIPVMGRNSTNTTQRRAPD